MAQSKVVPAVGPWGLTVRRLGLLLRPMLQRFGADLIRHPPDVVAVPRFLCPNGHKLYDFREEPGFADIADDIIAQGRTTLDQGRLFVLWQAIRNTRCAEGDMAEVGSYRGGSARFLALAAEHWDWNPTFHVMDTFTGHPESADFSRDGVHVPGLFGDTCVGQVIAYLSDLPMVRVRQGRFEDTCRDMADGRFALVHIDVDIYDSAVSCLRFFWPRMSDGGAIVVDDYGFTTCPGLRAAVDEFLRAQRDAAGWYMHTGQIVIQRRTGWRER